MKGLLNEEARSRTCPRIAPPVTNRAPISGTCCRSATRNTASVAIRCTSTTRISPARSCRTAYPRTLARLPRRALHNVAREGELHQEAPSPRRPLPGERAQGMRLSNEARRNVDESARAPRRTINRADRVAGRRRRPRRGSTGSNACGPEAVGACRLCHTLSEDTTAATGGRSFRAAWRVDPPEIPDRWMVRSQFSHDSHRLAACTKCHLDFSYNPPRPVVESQVTSDVLMPSIGLCRECHAQRVMATITLPGSDSGAGVASRCIDCHDYHRRRRREYGRLGGSQHESDWKEWRLKRRCRRVDDDNLSQIRRRVRRRRIAPGAGQRVRRRAGG